MASGPTKVLTRDSTGGVVLMVNVGGSSKSFRHRKGAEKDFDKLHEVMVETLGLTLINTEVNRDLCIADWDHSYDEREEKPGHPPENCRCIRCTIASFDFSESKCFVFAIGSHGYLKNGRLMVQFLDKTKRVDVSVNEMIDALSDKNCPSLKDIPRVVVVQACRGDKEDDGIEVIQSETTDHASGSADTSNLDVVQEPMDTSEEGLQGTEGGAEISSVEANLNLPENFLVVFTTTPGRVSKTNMADGSWFEDALFDEVKKHDFNEEPSLNFLHLLTRVFDTVSRRESNSSNPAWNAKKNVPCLQHTLLAPLIFTKPESFLSDVPYPS
ncbi:caspase-3-like isoform X1 [Mya arenaria]|uniref:caspase-3-like isoform X1 n=1 Tax=Mya arenaria TaxID=6604 RepID=UPI0022E41F79|nr:caspase-3-like isoform X1 [Mya arenaria]